MNTLPALSWLNTPAWLPLIYALLHTFWQGALATGGLFLVLRFVPAQRAGLRYGLTTAALVLVVLAGLGSWALLDVPRRSPVSAVHRDHAPGTATKHSPAGLPIAVLPSLPVPTGGSAVTRSVDVNPGVSRSDAFVAKRWVQWAAAGWLLGVFVSLLRAVKGTLGAGRLRRRCRDLADPRVLALAEQLRTRLGVSHRVRFLVCDEIGVPSMLGILYPAVLLPASLLTGVPLEQLRAIVAHELMHIRRWDYLANLAQMLVEALLFFNPFVWWISRQMRLEREACCDQVAAAECQSSACYVEAMVAVIERSRLAATALPPVLAATGPDTRGGNALDHARRLLIPGYQPAFHIRWFSLVAVLLVSGLALSGLWLGTRAVAQTIQGAGEKTLPKPADGSSLPAIVPGVPNDVLAAVRDGNAKQAGSLLEASVRPRKFGEEDAVAVLDSLVRARELRSFTTLYDRWRHFYVKDWKLSDELLAALVKDGRTDFLDALMALRFDLDRLTRAAGAADPVTAGWITRRVAEVTRQRADIEALEKASEQGDLAAIRRLLDAGADVNGVGQDDNTPLLRAVFKDRLEAAQFLLDHGAQVDKPRLPGWNYTPLCLVNSVPMAELLKKNGADVHAKLYERDVSILTYAAEWAKADVVAWFLKQGLDANMIGSNHQNLLFGLKDGATAEVLLAAGADPNVTDEFGRTPLTSAQSAEVARALVRHGADLRLKLKDGATLLEYAVMNTPREDNDPQGDAAFIEELIKQGAEFDPKGNGAKAMIQAAFSDRVGEVQVLLDHGVSPNAAYERGADEYVSALSRASMQAPQSLKLLLERGADPNATVPMGQMTLLDTALASGNFSNVEVLRRAGAKGLNDLVFYSAKGDAAKVSELLDQNVDPNEASSLGWTPLRYAVQHGEAEVAKRLLDHGASLDQFDPWGFSPYLSFVLDRQTMEANPSQAQMQWHLSPQEAKARLAALQALFTQHPPDPSYRDASGRAALHQAAWNGSFAVDLMLSEKPPLFGPDLLDKEGRTPLLLAALSPRAKDTRETYISDVDTPQQKKWNPQAHVTKQLLKFGARLDLVMPAGKTVGEVALAAAREANNAQLVSVLTDALKTPLPDPKLASPAPTSVATPSGPASAEATGQSTASTGKEARDLADFDSKQDDTIWTAAYAAIKAGDIQVIDGFLRRGLDANKNFGFSCSLLFLATDENQLAIVKLLLAHGASVLEKTSWGDVPLQRACWKGQREVADALIQAGAPVNELWHATGMGDVPALEARDKRQPLTPKEARDNLFFAVASGHPNTFEFLWNKLGPLDDTEKGKLLGDLYENVGKWGHANLLPVLEALGASPAKDGSRALAQAALGNYPELARALLERGVSPDAAPHGWGNFLRNAAGDGRIEMVRALLDHGANINVQDDQGFTPLSWAGYNGREDVCLLLLERGADGRIEDRDGHNAAWHAAAGPHCAEALARMIRAGVPVTGKDKRDQTILDHLMNFSTPEAWHGAFFMKVYSPADIKQFDESERRVVELLLAAGVNPDGGGDGVPLIQAMYSNHYDAACVLLAHGADALRKDKDGNMALFSLFNYAWHKPLPLDLFKTLLQRGGNPNPECTVPGMSPPMRTTLLETVILGAPRRPLQRASFAEAVKLLLDGGAKFAGVADDRVQALLQGTARDDLATIQQSIRQGAPISAADDTGWDALSITTALGYNDSAGWLIDHGADVNSHHRFNWNSPLSFAVANGQAELVDKLLSKGAKIDDSYNNLYLAVEQQNTRIFKALLKAGADPKGKGNVTMSTGGKPFTPRNSVTLYLCIDKGLTDMAWTLLDRGADPESSDLKQGQNLAYWAVNLDRPEILQSLLDHGANPLLKDDKGFSALDLARKSHPNLVSILEEAAKRKSAPAT